MWDYDLTEKDVRRILNGRNETEKIWLMSRILESAKYEDIWKYLSCRQVREWFNRLKLKKPIREAWQLALNTWEQV